MAFTGNEPWIEDAVRNGLVKPQDLPPGSKFYKPAKASRKAPKTQTHFFKVKLVSEANSREHWAAKAKRAASQKHTVALVLDGCVAPTGPLTVTITRQYGSRGKRMDCDNLARAAKHVRDAIADWLGRDDGDLTINWKYEQRSGDPGVVVEVRKH